MKKPGVRHLLIAGIAAVVLAASCKKDKDNKPEEQQPATETGYLRAGLQDSPGGHDSLVITEVPDARCYLKVVNGQERFWVQGNVPGSNLNYQKGTQSLRIYIEVFNGAGTYALGSAGAEGGYSENDAQHSFGAVTGYLTVDAQTDKRASGTFEFVGVTSSHDTITLSSGVFDLPIVDDNH